LVHLSEEKICSKKITDFPFSVNQLTHYLYHRFKEEEDEREQRKEARMYNNNEEEEKG
jgi:hypothetical protein